MGRRKNSLLLGVLSLFMSLVLVVGLVPTLALAEIVDEAAEGNQTAAADEVEATQNDAQRGQEVPENAGTVLGGVASTDVMPTNATADGVPRDSDPASGEDGADPTGATTDSTHRDQDQTGDKDGTEPAETAVDSTQHAQDSSEAKTGDDARKGEDQQKEKPDSAQAKERSSYPAFAPEPVELDGVKVGVHAPEGVFPADAKLSVAVAAAPEQERADAAVDDVRAAEKNVAASRIFDIKVLAADGTTELEPAGDAKVEVTFILAEATDKNLDTAIYHVIEDENANKLAAEALPIVEETGETVTAVTDGFSLYTVEFTYNKLEYVLQGDGTVALGEILQAVGLTGDVANVEVSDTSLFSASKETGEWMVTAHQAFSTTEWMKVTIGGIAYEIVVTDSQDTLSAMGQVGAMAAVTYVEQSWNGTEVVSTPSTHDATPVPSNGNMTSGWYYLNSNVTKSGRVESINGDVHLILGDGYTLDVKGLYVPSGITLYIYGQANGTGKIYSHPSGGAAIGGYSGHDNGNIEIHGGTIEATGYDHCAGIGSNDGRTTGTITIYGGTVNAVGGSQGAGIGAGRDSDGGTIKIYGGDVTATGGADGAGIGAGRDSDGGTIQIYGGTIIATGKDSSAGIGGGDASGSRADFTTIEIYGGVIEATGNSKGAGIGGGEYGSANITISGGTIRMARGGGSGGAGIGSGVDGTGSTITITGGTISATSSQGYGIGNGKNKKGDASTITLGSAETDTTMSIDSISYSGTVIANRALWNDNGAYAVGTMSDSQKTRMTGSPVRLLSFDEVDSWEKLQCAIDSAGSNDTIKLSGDVIASSFSTPSQQVKKGKTITIDLNGHKIDRGLYQGASRSDGSVIVNNGNLTINDSAGGGVVRGGNYYNGDDNTSGGGGIRNFGTLTITGGTIRDNLSLRGGGGIYVATGATLNLYGGTITGNVSDARFGSGIYVSNEVTKGATLNVKGSPVVSGNTVRDSTTPSNVNLAGLAVIHVTGDLGTGASIGVGKSTGYEPVITQGLSVHGTPGNFVSDDGGYSVRANASDEAQLKKLYTVGIDANIKNGTVSADPQRACAGDAIVLTVVPSDPYYYEVDQVSYFDGAIDHVVQNNNVYSFSMPASSVRVSATFKKVAHTVAIAQMTNGTVTADKQTAFEGDTVTLTPTPASGYQLAGISVKDKNNGDVAAHANYSSTPPVYTFTMPKDEVTVLATFETGYAVRKSAVHGTINAVESAGAGEPVTFTVKPDDGYKLTGGSVSVKNEWGVILFDFTLSTSTEGTFTMPDEPVTISATFEALDQNLLLSLSGAQYGSYMVSVNGGNPVTLLTDGSKDLTAKTDDVIKVTFSPKEDGAVEHFYLEDRNHPMEEHHEKDINNNTYTFNMPAYGGKGTGVSVRFGPKRVKKTVGYIDENGEKQTVEATVLSGTETVNYRSTGGGFYFYVPLGDKSSSEPQWYVVEDSINYSRTDNFELNMELNGDVRIIVADDAALSVQGEIAEGSLSVYGQAGQRGTLTTDAIKSGTVNIYGGKTNIRLIDSSTVNMKNGSLTVSENMAIWNMTISGGTTNVTGTVETWNSLTLGCDDENDNITIGKYDVSRASSFKVADSQTLTDGVDTYTGSLNYNEMPTRLGGKTLRLDVEHKKEEMTLYPAIAPIHDPITDTYLDGHVAYYTCTHCDAYFVEESGQLVRKAWSDLVLPYFRFRTMKVAGFTLCEILAYNGEDASVKIPDHVPAGYMDASQVGNTVTAIDSHAFENKAFVTDVTIGDTISGIYKSAFQGCTGLVAVTTGGGLSHIGSGAFTGCTSLKSFSSTSTNDIAYSYRPEEGAGSFDEKSGIRFYGPHGSTLLSVARDFGGTFVPTNRHVEPTWTWADDYSSATATFDCNNSCERDSRDEDVFVDSKITVSEDGKTYVAQVTVDGETYTDTKNRSPFTLTVEDWAGRRIQIEDVASGDTVASVKSKIAAAKGYPVDRQRLQKDSDELADDNTLAFYAIDGQSVVRLTVTPYFVTWKNEDGSTIDTTNVIHGEMPVHSNPAKAADDLNTYFFAGWSPTVAKATEDATYTATFTARKTIVGVTLKSDTAKKTYAKGESLSMDGLTLEIEKLDGSKKTLAVTSDMISGFDGNKVGKQALTVTYKGYTATYEVEVTDTPTPVPVPANRFAVETRGNAPVIGVNNKDNVVAATLSDDDLDAGCSLLLVSSPFGEDGAPTDDRAVLLDKVEELGAKEGVWYDVSLYKMQDGNATKLDKVPVAVKMTAEVPESLRKEGRTFYLLRAHAGKVTVAAQSKDNVLGWETGEFSTYLLAYSDEESSGSGEASESKPVDKSTSDASDEKDDTKDDAKDGTKDGTKDDTKDSTKGDTTGDNSSGTQSGWSGSTTSVGSSSGSVSSTTVPKTRDDTDAALPLGLAVGSMALLAVGASRRRRGTQRQR